MLSNWTPSRALGCFPLRNIVWIFTTCLVVSWTSNTNLDTDFDRQFGILSFERFIFDRGFAASLHCQSNGMSRRELRLEELWKRFCPLSSINITCAVQMPQWCHCPSLDIWLSQPPFMLWPHSQRTNFTVKSEQCACPAALVEKSDYLQLMLFHKVQLWTLAKFNVSHLLPLLSLNAYWVRCYGLI